MGIEVVFITPQGEYVRADGEEGFTLLEVAQGAGMPLEGTCEGQMACATCHVIVTSDWFARLPIPSEEEEDLLDLTPAACHTSRLACQIVLTDNLAGLEIKIPWESHLAQ